MTFVADVQLVNSFARSSACVYARNSSFIIVVVAVELLERDSSIKLLIHLERVERLLIGSFCNVYTRKSLLFDLLMREDGRSFCWSAKEMNDEGENANLSLSTSMSDNITTVRIRQWIELKSSMKPIDIFLWLFSHWRRWATRCAFSSFVGPDFRSVLLVRRRFVFDCYV